MNLQGFRTNGHECAEGFQNSDGNRGRQFTSFSIHDILENTFYTGKVRHKKELFDGCHLPIVDQSLFDAVQKRKKENRSRRTATVNRLSNNPHLLTGLLRCDQCGAKLWSQRQGNRGGTYYKVPDKGLEHPCRHTGKAFNGQVIEDQASLIFADFTLRDDWIDWVIETYVDKSDLAEGLKRRGALTQEIERARLLCLEGDLSKERYHLIKSNAEAEMDSVYVPELDDAQETAKLLQDFNALWRAATAGQRNRLLLTILEAIYLDVESRQIVGLRPRQAFLTLFEAVEDNDAVTLSSNPTGNFGRAGGPNGTIGRTRPARSISREIFPGVWLSSGSGIL
jgi:hypothetical protein